MINKIKYYPSEFLLNGRKYIVLLLLLFISSSIIFADDQGLKHYKNNKFKEAQQFYEQILADRQNDPAASLGMGAAKFKLGDIPAAAKAFEDALKTDDKTIKTKAFYNMGNALYNQQRLDESLAFYRKALELNPTDDDAKYNYELAKYHVQQQQDQQQDDKQDQNQQDQKQNKSDNQNNQDNEPQETDKEEPDEQKDEESQNSQQKERDTPKSQKQINAEAILDALKDDEKIHQKVKIAQQSNHKLEKDW